MHFMQRKSQQKHISVCVCTFKRVQMLSRLLKCLENQDTSDLFSYSIIIVDNDIDKSAQRTAEGFINNSQLRIKYYVEPEQNISLARNKTLEHAEGDYVAFIDDDEFPPQNWLITMFEFLNTRKADGVLGPVKPHFEEPPPAWIIKGDFYEKPSHRSGHILHWDETRTSNALVKRSILTDSKNWFRPEYGRGGEDKDFFRRLMDKRCIFLWCNESPVYETIPPERWSRSFMLRRALLRGKMSILYPTFNFLDILKSLLAIVIYSLVLPFMLIRQHLFMKYLIKNFDHIGKILAVLKINIIKQTYVVK